MRAVTTTFIIISQLWRALCFKVLPHQSLWQPRKMLIIIFRCTLQMRCQRSQKVLPKVTHVSYIQTPYPSPNQWLHFSGHRISACFIQHSDGIIFSVQHAFQLVFLTALLFLPTGGRDKRGGPILTFPARSNHDRIRQEDLRKLVTYLASVPR